MGGASEGDSQSGQGDGAEGMRNFREMDQKGVFQFSIEVRVLVRIYQGTEVRCYTACS
jgi:hypothetical protein